MEILIGFPLSIVLILVISLLILHGNPESTLARGLAYLAGIMLIVSIGFTVNIFLPQNMSTLGIVVTFITAILFFVKAADFIKWKLFFILLGAEAVATVLAVIIINSL